MKAGILTLKAAPMEQYGCWPGQNQKKTASGLML
jgi:hypothetical protein